MQQIVDDDVTGNNPFWHILGASTDGNLHSSLSSGINPFPISYLQLSDLRGDVPHQVLAQKIQAVRADELGQRLQLCPQGDMNN